MQSMQDIVKALEKLKRGVVCKECKNIVVSRSWINYYSVNELIKILKEHEHYCIKEEKTTKDSI